MDPKTLRNWGLGAGGALIAGAIGLAVTTGDPQPPAPPDRVIAGPLGSQAPRPGPGAQAGPPAGPRPLDPVTPNTEPVFEAASSDEPPPTENPSFIVRFAPTHALGRAQAQAAEGRLEEARRAAEQAIRRDRALRGLCFDRFTLGGAETVLAPCVAPTAGERDAVRDFWVRRLAEMDGVTYAEPNAILSNERR